MSTQAVTPNQTPPLNDLVTKIRGAHPGAYDDIDDATLTKKVLAKYPQYSDLAAPKMTVGAPSNTNIKSPEGPISQGLTTMETKLADIPSATLHSQQRQSAENPGGIPTDAHGEPIEPKDIGEVKSFKNFAKTLNPVDTSEGNVAMDIGGTAANLLPYALDLEGGGIGESPLGQTAKGIAKASTDTIKGIPQSKIFRTATEAGKPIGVTAENLPVVGAFAKGVKTLPETYRNLRSIWSPPKPDLAAEPLGPPKPSRELTQSISLGGKEEATPESAPLGKIPVRSEKLPSQSPVRETTVIGRPQYPAGRNIDLHQGMQTPGGAIVAPKVKGLLSGEVEKSIPQTSPPATEKASIADKSFNPEDQEETIRSGEGIENRPQTLSGEGALRQVLTGQDNANLLKLAKSRGINVVKESQLKPGAANGLLVNKIIDNFTPEELEEIGNRYTEGSRFRHNFGDIGPEAWKTLSLQNYFPDLKIPATTLKRTATSIASANPRSSSPLGAPDGDLTGILNESVKKVKAKGAN